MSKKILFCSLFILIFLIPSKQDPNAKTWRQHNTTVHADSILAAMDRGDSVLIDSCEIFDPLIQIGMFEELDTIRSLVRIAYSTFHDMVSFLSCCFLRDVCFDSSIFLEKVSFFHTTFNGVSAFSGVSFHNPPSFSYSTFTQDVNFSGATFSEGAAFSSTIFGGYASFGGATIRTLAYFFEARFDTTVNFSGVECGLGLFVMATFNGDAFFRDASFEKANFRKAQFGGIVDFSLKEFKDVAVSWDQLKGHLWYFKPTVYKLMKYFEEQRQLDDADGAYLFLKDQERMEKRWYIRYPEYWFIQQTCGYGVDPLLPLRASLVVVALFAIPYYLIKIREPKWALGAGLKRIGIKAWNAFYFSGNTFVSGAPIEWTPEDTRSSKRHYLFRILTTVERTSGWILLVLFVVTLTRKFIR